MRAPGAARRSFDGLAGVVEASLLDDMRLPTSEILTNAAQHSGCLEGTPNTVDTSLGEDVMRVEVLDQGDGVGPLRPRSSTPPSGLGYVHLLSDRWASVIVSSFQVWFEIDVTESSDGLFSRATALTTARSPNLDRQPVH